MSMVALDSVAAALDFLRASGAAGLVSDTRRLQRGEAFVAWPGLAVDPRRYVGAALADGAPACLVDAEGVAAYGFDDARIGVLPGLKAAAGLVADAFYGQPSAQLDVVAVTGTNGKTSTAWWTAQVLSALGRPCGLIGTLGCGLPFDVEGRLRPEGVQPTGFTTPDPVTLHAALDALRRQGATACALEASSIGLEEARMNGLRVRVAQYTNFSRDHLDYHGSMEAYWAAKRALFAWPGLTAAVVNLDDESGAQLAAELTAERDAGGAAGPALDLWSTSLQRPARLRAAALAYEGDGLAFDLSGEGLPGSRVRTTLVGDYNVANLLTVLGAVCALGRPLVDALPVCARLAPVPGRMQRVVGDPRSDHPGGLPQEPLVVVDYAHTPDALDQALRALRPLAAQRGGRLWCVFGCGGNRDATKRPLMGAIARRLADQVVLTSDNPRHESPTLILSQILAGMCGHHEADVIEDRAQAIAHAVQAAATVDVVLVAGKGHEAMQEVAGSKLPFDDVVQARRALVRRATGTGEGA